MKRIRLALVLMLVVFSGCDCEDGLFKACPVPTECWVEQGVENNSENLITSDFPRYVDRGSCSLGVTACDEDVNVYCDKVVYSVDEVCDFNDNDCDGETDEGFDEDRDGWTACNGDCDDSDDRMFPTNPEVCDNLDNNCDGVIPVEEYTDADGDGSLACFDCDDSSDNVGPNFTELCDNIDNDCNGLIDDETRGTKYRTCGPPSNTGICKRERGICINGETYCLNAVYPTAEECDGLDNDCDGLTDEGLLQLCNSECGVGIETCSNGNWVDCTALQPVPELCGDGLDNNCNGQVDEGCICFPGDIELCNEDVVDENGVSINCGTGVKECSDTGNFGPCVWILNQPEVCNNYDDDCDGVVDDLTKTCGPSDFAGIGECKLGTQTCTTGIWSDCNGAVAPRPEVCNEKDDDCDGLIDEELRIHEKVDMTFIIDGSGSMCQYVEAIASALGRYTSDFEDSEHKFSLVIFPFILEANSVDPWVVITDLVDVNQFISILNSIVCTYPGVESSYDTMLDISNPAITPISWRSDAYPYLILMTDENAQSWYSITESQVASSVSNCSVGECEQGDKYETFIFTFPSFYRGWDEITYFDPERLISIYPPDEEEYVNKLRSVLTNVCL